MNRDLSCDAISIVIANPNPIACLLFAQALEGESDLKVVGRVTESQQLTLSLQQHQPRVLLVSIHFQELVQDHFRLLAEVLGANPQVACIVLLDSREPETAFHAFRARTKGVFVCADGNIQLLGQCIRRVVDGQIWIDPVQMNYIVSSVPAAPWKEAVAKRPVSRLLTPREEEVVGLLVEGLRNHEIALRMGLSDNTIKNYIFRIFEKLGFSSRVEVVLYATSRMQEERESARAMVGAE